MPPDFPCYYDIVGKEYAARDYVFGLATLRKYLDGALALAGTGGAYRTDAEYKHDRSIGAAAGAASGARPAARGPSRTRRRPFSTAGSAGRRGAGGRQVGPRL